MSKRIYVNTDKVNQTTIRTESKKDSQKRDDYTGKSNDEIYSMVEKKKKNLTGCNPEMRKRAKERSEERKAMMTEKELGRLQNIIDIPSRLGQLDKIGMKFLKSSGENKTLDRDQALVWKSMFETYSAKILSNAPTRKKTEDDNPKPTFTITGAPTGKEASENIEEVDDFVDKDEDDE
jgi:hypothetical protein